MLVYIHFHIKSICKIEFIFVVENLDIITISLIKKVILSLNKKDNLKKKKGLLKKRILWSLTTIIHLFFAFLGGTIVMEHFQLLFDPNHIFKSELFFTMLGNLMLLAGIVGSYLSLHFVFEKTKLEKIFPNIFEIWFRL